MLKAHPVTLEGVRTLLDKRQFKQALKDARVAYRQSPTEEAKTLLQSCSFARAEELQKHGLEPEAKHVLDELCDLRPLPELFHPPLSELLVRLGIYEQYCSKFGISAAIMSDEQLRSMADIAVVSGRAGSIELGEGSTAVRAALKSLEAGDTDLAMQAVESIPRNSPFADWKLFVRGLSAYYRGDDESLKANWSRLDTRRRAYQIAKRLIALSDVASGTPRTPEFDLAISAIEQVMGGEVVAHIDRVRTSLNNGDQRRLVELLRPCLVALGQRAPRLKDRVVELVVQKAIQSSSKELLEQLIRATTPGPAFDPQWNRAWALFHERDEDSNDDLIDDRWENYIADLAHISCWSETDRRLGEAVIWNHLGRLHAMWGQTNYMDDEDDDFGDDFDFDDAAESADDRLRAQECFEKAQAIAPEVLEFWKSTVRATMDWKNKGAEVEALLDLLQHFPEDLESLNHISKLLMKDDRFPDALPFLERAMRLKPLDEAIQGMLCSSHLETARQKSLKKDFVAAREHFDAAEKCFPPAASGFSLEARRSVMERKAGNQKLADSLEERVIAAEPDPNHALLQLLIESIRYKLAKAVTGRYDAEWRKALSKKCTSQAAGTMANLLREHLTAGGYAGIDSHCKLLTAYLKRTSRVKFEREHLRSVCEFFLTALSKIGPGKTMEELRKAAKRGQNQFPDDPCFPLFACEVEYAMGPRKANLHTMTSLLNRAMDLAQKKPNLASPGLIDRIRERQNEVESIQSIPFFDSPFELPFGPSQSKSSTPFEGLRFPPQMQSMIDEICQRTGMTVEEVLDQVADRMPNLDFFDDEDHDEP